MLKPLLLSEVAQALEARVVGADVAFTAVSTDSRRIEVPIGAGGCACPCGW